MTESRRKNEGIVKKVILLIALIVLLLFLYGMKVFAASNFKCDRDMGMHIFTQKYSQTLVSTYDHASQYGTCHVRVETVNNYEKCQCGYLIRLVSTSSKETHTQPHG